MSRLDITQSNILIASANFAAPNMAPAKLSKIPSGVQSINFFRILPIMFTTIKISTKRTINATNGSKFPKPSYILDIYSIPKWSSLNPPKIARINAAIAISSRISPFLKPLYAPRMRNTMMIISAVLNF